MYYSAQSMLTNYIPLRIEEGMMFKAVLYPNTDKEMIEILKMDKYKTKWAQAALSIDDVFTKIGYPVELSIIDGDGNTTLAISDQIGWWDEGEDTEDLRDITLADINRILMNNGNVEIDISEDALGIYQIIPTISEGKVILRMPIDQEEAEDEDNIPNENDYGDDVSNEEMFNEY